MGAVETGKFWRCPSCRKLIPSRQAQCPCGASRPLGDTVTPPEVSPLPRPPLATPTPSWGWALVAVVTVFGMILLYRTGRDDSQRTPGVANRGSESRFDESRAPAPLPPVTVPVTNAAPAAEWVALAPPNATPTTSEPLADSPKPISIALPQPPTVTAPDQRLEATYVDPMKTEPYWQQRLFQSRERVRSAYESCVSQFGQGSIGDVGQTTWASAKAGIVTAIVTQQQLEEDARRAGAAPGWVRFDWSVYPTLELEIGGVSSSLTRRHPCSVPDLLKEVRY